MPSSKSPAKVLLWAALIIPDILAGLLAYPVALLAAALSEETARRYLSWFLTPDNQMTGDRGHEDRWDGKPEYFQKVAWLWRNRAYGFSSSVLKARTVGPVTIAFGEQAVSNRPLLEGTVIRTTPEGHWQFYHIRKTFKGRCLRVNLGWKLWDPPGKPLFGSYVIHFNPFMGTS